MVGRVEAGVHLWGRRRLVGGYWLDRWASWMRWNAGEYPQVPSCAAGFSGAASNYAVAETDSADYWDGHVVPMIIGVVDAAIDDLPPDHKRAIWWKYGITRIEPPGAVIVFEEAFQRVRVYVLDRVAIAA
jgi:hypothetical protein